MIKEFLKIATVALSMILVVGCASGPSYKQAADSFPKLPADQGRIYIYRPSSAGFAVQPDVKLNGETIGSSTPDGFFFVDRPAGDYEVSTTTEMKKSLTFHLDAGQTRYVRLKISLGVFVGHVYPELVDNSEGETELAEETKFVGKK